MKSLALAFGMILMTTSAHAGALTHKLSSSVQLTVDAAATNVSRIGSTYSISGIISILRTDQLLVQFLPVLSLWRIHPGKPLQLPKILLDLHFLSVSLLHKLTHYPPLLRQWVRWLTSGRSPARQLELREV